MTFRKDTQVTPMWGFIFCPGYRYPSGLQMCPWELDIMFGTRIWKVRGK